MRLETKGEIRPPPNLKGLAQSVSLEIQSWPGIVSATHWSFADRTKVDGADFYLGEKELGHIHLNGELHILVTSGLRRRLVEAGLAQPFPWSDEWIQSSVVHPRDARSAVWLFRLAYDRLAGTPISNLRQRISEGAGGRAVHPFT